MSWPALGDAHLIGALMVWGLLMASLTAGRHPALSLRFGVTALVFYVAISGAASQFEAFRNIAISDAASKTLVAAESSGLIGQRAGVLVTLLAFLTVCAVGVNARALVTGLGHASRRGSELARVGVYVLLALPYPLSGLKVGTQFLDLLLLKWTISSMESKGTYFMDTTPRTWDQLRDERFLKRLGGEEGRFAKQTPVEDLVGALSSDCVQEESAQEGWLDRPAHCVSPVQAQLYCESVGARLPTPAEWRDENASAGAEAPGGLGEWTMKQQHGVATFFRSNRDGATEVPVSVSERGVLFRCAVTF